MIDINKQYRTRDGREVRIYATDDRESDQAVHGAILDGDEWRVYAWYADGKYTYCDPKCRHDLIEVRPRHKRTVWVNIYGPTSFTSHISREMADNEFDDDRIACIKVELDFEEGEGL